VNVALIAVGAGIPVLGLLGLPTLLRADRTSAAAAARLRPWIEELSQFGLFAGADHSTLERLALAAREVVLPAGHVVIREGDDADALWILIRGELAVTAHGDGPREVELASVTAPDYVGELGILHGIPRTATVRTRHFLAALETSRPSASLLSIAGTRMARTPGRGPRAQPKPPARAG
jgi:hypothetical protein